MTDAEKLVIETCKDALAKMPEARKRGEAYALASHALLLVDQCPKLLTIISNQENDIMKFRRSMSEASLCNSTRIKELEAEVEALHSSKTFYCERCSRHSYD